MKNKFFLFIFLISLVISGCNRKSPVDYVNPFICTQGDHGQWLPAALVPYGQIKLCPDTYPGSLTADGDFAHSGYDYSDSLIRSFSHFHSCSSGGTSVGERSGFFSFLPFTKLDADLLTNPVIEIDKKSETARAGYYSVRLVKEDILAELTALVHTGYHKYTFPKDKPSQIIISFRPGNSSGLTIKKSDKQIIEGIVKVFGGIYFVVEFNSPVNSYICWDGKEMWQPESIDNQDNVSIICNFGNLKGKPLEIRVGTSLTSIDGAHKNLEAESSKWSFLDMKKKAEKAWNENLSRIEVEGNNEEDKIIFYTALYHSCFMPNILNDIDGYYPGIDRKIHKAEGYNHYSNYAFWDSFRTKYPLYSLFQPEVYRDIIISLRDINEQADNFAPFPKSIHGPTNKAYSPRGKNGFQVFFNVRHEHMLMVMVDAYFKGLYNISEESVYPLIRREALMQMPEIYDPVGFIPARPDRTCECSWDSWCVAQMARATGNQNDYDFFMKRSEYWKNTWDSTIHFFRARAADGTWLDFPENPAINREKYTYEGTKWQLRWNVLHNVPALADAFGGEKAFVKELEIFFDSSLYTAGNQIDLHAPFLFNYSGAPWLTQKWVRKLLKEPVLQRYGTHSLFPKPVFDKIYKATPDGYLEEMDDDYGCMSSWYVMSAMGLYQVCPGDPVYQITAPVFDKVIIHLNNTIYKGNKFIIKANSLNNENIYIQSAALNGKPFNKSQITHSEIIEGGELVFEMGAEPNFQWGL